jgi:gas vesicle protein
MGQSPEELRRDIERTREDLGDHLDALGDRVSPGRIIERRRNRLRDGLTSARERVFGHADEGPAPATGGGVGDRVSEVGDTVKQAPELARQQAQGNPMLAGVLAFGAGFAAAAVFPGTATEGELASRVKERAQPLKDEVSKVGQDVAATMRQTGEQAAEQLKSTAAEGVEQVKETAKSTAAETKEAGTQAAQEVKDEAKSSGT